MEEVKERAGEQARVYKSRLIEDRRATGGGGREGARERGGERRSGESRKWCGGEESERASE